MQETGQKNSIPLSDEALALRFQNGDDAAFSELAARYLKVIRIKACSFREIFSLEREDLYQEGLLGLLDAANSYKPSERTSFETYAGRCISNRIVSAVRRSSSLKNSFLNNAVPIEEMGRPWGRPPFRPANAFGEPRRDGPAAFCYPYFTFRF